MVNTHQIIFTRNEELSGTRIALTATTTTELVVNAARIVTSRTNHDETAEFLNAFAEFNIGTTTSHISSKRDGTFFASFGDDSSFAFVILSVQDFVWNLLIIEIASNFLVVGDRIRTHEHWLTLSVVFLDFFGDSAELTSLGLKDQIVFIDTDDWAVWWNLNYVKCVNLLELFSLGKGSTGHTGKFTIKTEEVLE